jgi:glycerol-3-phosphate acyltransferase PlsX
MDPAPSKNVPRPQVETIALDVMGGDDAPGPELEGALMAVREGRARVILVGDEARVRAGLAARKVDPASLGDRLTIQHAGEVITMDDHPAQAARAKKDSSMRVAFELVKRGIASAVVSAGNSGAMMACGLFVLKRVRGLDRPGVCTTFPTRTGVCALIDMGANTDVKAVTLAQFAVLGATYVHLLHGVHRPRVGLLSNGTEDGKGTELLRESLAMLRGTGARLPFDFRGYVEGRDLFGGNLDVVVTDGFTGNVVLKTAEGAASLIMKLVKEEVLRTPFRKLGALLLKGAFGSLARRLDYAEHGGAPLLGVEGNVVLCHGSSNGKAIKNGIAMAARFASAGLVDGVKHALEEAAPLWAHSASAVGSA